MTVKGERGTGQTGTSVTIMQTKQPLSKVGCQEVLTVKNEFLFLTDPLVCSTCLCFHSTIRYISFYQSRSHLFISDYYDAMIYFRSDHLGNNFKGEVIRRKLSPVILIFD